MTETQRKTLGLAIASLVLGCFFWIPLLGFLLGMVALILGIVALVQINKNKAQLKGEGLAIAGIVMGGLSVIMIPIVGMLAAIAIPNLLRARVVANDAMAKAHFNSMRSALELYVLDNDGNYPMSAGELTTAGGDPILPTSPEDSEAGGYVFDVQADGSTFTVVARPVSCGATGSLVLQMGVDGNIIETPCRGMNSSDQSFNR